MESLVEIKAWRCGKCGRVHLENKPSICTCSESIITGNIVGCFRVLEKRNGRKLSATCLLCGLDTEIDTSNIRRQKSCGCKPRHIEVLSNSELEVRYACRRCQKVIVTDLPADEWCCFSEEEE